MKALNLDFKKLLLTASLIFAAYLGYCQNIATNKNFFGNVAKDDASGNKRVYEKDIFDNTILKDERGATVATIKKDIFGNVTEEYSDGTKRVYKKNIFGDITVEDETGPLLPHPQKIFSATKLKSILMEQKEFTK